HVYRNIGPNSEQLLHLYRTADLFVLPTLGDCFSVACIEALACGLPVITCPVGGIPELLLDGENGLLVPPGDVRSLGAAIAALAGDETRRRGMGARGRALAEQRFDNTVNVRRILAIMRSVAEEGTANRVASRALSVAAGHRPKS
ncbi:MAG TPA: glycosyltransferase, partial [Chloroflexota bacterium]|nr:glycosyltransferase [Chloroflexota bacterium]